MYTYLIELVDSGKGENVNIMQLLFQLLLQLCNYTK